MQLVAEAVRSERGGALQVMVVVTVKVQQVAAVKAATGVGSEEAEEKAEEAVTVMGVAAQLVAVAAQLVVARAAGMAAT